MYVYVLSHKHIKCFMGKKRMLLHQSLDEKGTSVVANAILASYQFFHEE
jgi:hypothetical protein